MEYWLSKSGSLFDLQLQFEDLGRCKTAGTEKTDQLPVIRIHQGIDFSYAGLAQMPDKFNHFC